MLFAGDTGFSQHIIDIADRIGPMTVSLLPIGAYAPRVFMQSMHMDPEDAAVSHLELSSQHSIGMHWGTFKLTQEPLSEPPLYLAAMLNRHQIPAEQFIVSKLGATHVYEAVAGRVINRHPDYHRDVPDVLTIKGFD